MQNKSKNPEIILNKFEVGYNDEGEGSIFVNDKDWAELNSQQKDYLYKISVFNEYFKDMKGSYFDLKKKWFKVDTGLKA